FHTENTNVGYNLDYIKMYTPRPDQENFVNLAKQLIYRKIIEDNQNESDDRRYGKKNGKYKLNLPLNSELSLEEQIANLVKEKTDKFLTDMKHIRSAVPELISQVPYQRPALKKPVPKRAIPKKTMQEK